mgnify:CR=1 FL=1
MHEPPNIFWRRTLTVNECSAAEAFGSEFIAYREGDHSNPLRAILFARLDRDNWHNQFWTIIYGSGCREELQAILYRELLEARIETGEPKDA